MAALTPEQAYAWDQILVWSVQAHVRWDDLWQFMVMNGMPPELRERLLARWMRLTADGVRFDAGR